MINSRNVFCENRALTTMHYCSKLSSCGIFHRIVVDSLDLVNQLSFITVSAKKNVPFVWTSFVFISWPFSSLSYFDCVHLKDLSFLGVKVFHEPNDKETRDSPRGF